MARHVRAQIASWVKTLGFTVSAAALRLIVFDNVIWNVNIEVSGSGP